MKTHFSVANKKVNAPIAGDIAARHSELAIVRRLLQVLTIVLMAAASQQGLLAQSDSNAGQWQSDQTREQTFQVLSETLKNALAASPGSAERNAMWSQYLSLSANVVRRSPDLTAVWLFRALAAVETGNERIAREAGNRLVELGADKDSNEPVKCVMAALGERGWLGSDSHRVDASQTSSKSEVLTMVHEALVSKEPKRRHALFSAVMERSEGLKAAYSKDEAFWVSRAIAALELDRREAGIEAANALLDAALTPPMLTTIHSGQSSQS